MTREPSHESLLALDYSSSEAARRVQRALDPEVGDIDGDRSQVTLTRDGSRLELRVVATDLVALRASLNTWLSLVSVAERAGDAEAVAGF